MAEINDTLVLKDAFSSTVDKYVNKMEKVRQTSLSQRNIEAEIEEIMTREQREAEAAAEAKKREKEAAREAARAQREAEREAQRAARAAEKAAELRLKLAQNIALQKVEDKAQALRDYGEERAERAAQSHERLVNVLRQLGNVLTSPIRALPRFAQGIQNVIQKIAGAKSPMDDFIKRIRMTAMGLFTARRMITYIKNALARAPADMASGIENMTKMFKDGFDRAVLSLVRGFLPAMERLRTVMQSSGGQNLLKAFSQGMELLGRGIGIVIDKISELVTWAGDHLNQVLITGAVLLGIYAVKMAAVAVSSILANAGLLLIIGAAIAVASALDATGGTADDVISRIAKGFGFLYAVIYNTVAGIWNYALAPFAEAFATFLDNPIDAITQLLLSLADFALMVLGKIAAGIDALFGSNLSAAVNGWSAGLESRMSKNYSTYGSVGRMKTIDPFATAKQWGEKSKGISDMFDPAKLGQYQLTELQDINKNTGATAKKVDMAAEDLKAFVDMAEREYVMRVNMQTVTPTITVNGQNTGNSREDAEALANRLADVLADLRSSSPSVPVDYVYTGGIG